MANYIIVEREIKGISKRQIEYKCPICKVIGQKSLKHIKRNPQYIYCSKECCDKHKSILKYDSMSIKVGCDFEKWLATKYSIEKLSTRDISQILYENKTNSPNVLSWLKKLGIPIRGRSESISLQFDKEGRREVSKEIAIKYLNSKESREKIRLKMQTEHYRKNASEIKKGSKNPMYGITGAKHPKYDPNLSEIERIKKRINNDKYDWRLSIFKRDKFTCQVCQDSQGGNLVAHHLNCYKYFPEERWDISNGVTLCNACHREFHKKYGYNNKTTKENFEEFTKSR